MIMLKVLIFIFLFLSTEATQALTPEEVIKSSLTHYPLVIQAVSQIEEDQNRLKESQGQFDAKIEGDVDTRTEGYYNGDAYKLQIKKPIPYLNGSIYGGKRQSYGQFPSYEGKYNTLDGGENFVGFSLSVLRNSLIDLNRYNIRIRKQNLVQSQFQLENIKANIQAMATQAYWFWAVKGLELKVYEDILKLAQLRGVQIHKRIKAGDLAQIYEVENNQYINKREAQFLKSQMAFVKASNQLSLFYRNSNGQPIIPQRQQLSPSIEKKLPLVPNPLDIKKRALRVNLDLKILDSQVVQAQLEESLGRNDLLPKVDVNFEWNQDSGNGPTQLTQDENRILLKVDIPIEYNKGLGKMRAAQNKQKQIKQKRQLAKEKVDQKTDTLINQVNYLSQIYEKTNEASQLASKLAVAERKKFSVGDSDLILVNIREENLAEAMIQNLSVLFQHKSTEAELNRLILNFIQ